MKTIRTIIVDDEPLALQLLGNYLKLHSNIEIVAECQNGREAIHMTSLHQPDLMFLDIQMPGLSGFDVIRNLQADNMPLIVFITAYDQYALNAFDVHAVDYLLKPLERESLARAITRCNERLGKTNQSNDNKSKIIQALSEIGNDNHSSTTNQASQTYNNSQGDSQGLPKIIVKDRNAINILDQEDIDWIDAAGDYMCIHVAGETHIMRSTLKALLKQLEPSIFQRIHRSTIVNLSRVQKIIPCTKGEYFLQLENNEQIKVSRNFKQVVKDLIAKHEQK